MACDGVEPGCAPRPRRQFLEPLGEDPTAAKDGIAVEPAGYYRQLHHSAADWKVRQPTAITAMDAQGRRGTRHRLDQMFV